MLGREDLDDGHRRTAVSAGERGFFFCRRCLAVRCGLNRWNLEQCSGAFQVVAAPGIGEEAVVADPVEAFGQDVLQEPADELVGFERH